MQFETMVLLFHNLFPLLIGVLLGISNAQFNYNYKPIIGILTQEPPNSLLDHLEDKNYTSFFPASYAKYLENSGARIVPIMINQDQAYYEKMAASLNGFLFPGGSVSFTSSSGYGRAGQILYNLILDANSKMNIMPLWGTCLGFEMMAYLAAGEEDWLTDCNARNKADSLVMEDGYEHSYLFSQIPDYVMPYLTEYNCTVNFHYWCLTPKDFIQSGLSNHYKLLATSYDFDNLQYVSLMEHKYFPLFGSQFHPEKNSFEWANDVEHNAIPHSPESLAVVQYFAHFFVNIVRANNQAFATEEEEKAALLFNYQPINTGKFSPWEQVYLFR